MDARSAIDEITKFGKECNAMIEEGARKALNEEENAERVPHSFAIVITPDRCNISVGGGISKHKMVNQCDRKLAFKVRSSNNSNYSVNINSGFIDVAETKEFIITRKAGKPQPDKLVVNFMYANVLEALEKYETGEVVGETIMKLSTAE